MSIAINSDLVRVGALLTAGGVEWAAAGGWAIDLFLDRVTRHHNDLDIVIWRDQQLMLPQALAGWNLRVAHSGQLRSWPRGQFLERPLHELHAQHPNGARVEFLLNDRALGMWIFRRDLRIRRPETAVIRQRKSIPFLAPEVVLLYKSKAPRPIDEEDFRNAAPHLCSDARAWLIDALDRTGAAGLWLDALWRGEPTERGGQ